MNNSSEEIDQGRRGFLGAAAGVATMTLAPGVLLHTIASAEPRAERVTDAVRYGMLIDTTRCAEGCTACVSACNQENGLDLQQMPAGMDPEKWDRQEARWIRKVKLEDNLTGRVTNLPMMCQHCEHPPCVDVCPTGASFKRADGIVLVDRHLCIGCRYCMMACPYKARSFVHEPQSNQKPDVPRGMGTVEACTLCVHKVDRGEQPACVSACASAGHGAILFGDVNDPNSDISKRIASVATRQIREDLNLNTGVRYTGV